MKSKRLLTIGAFAAALGLVPLALALGVAEARVSRSDLALFAGVVELVQQHYVKPVGTGELTKDALKGMLTRLDPHSDFMDEREFKESEADLSGEFGGLGIEITEQGGIPKVISPIDGTPAAEAGIQPGDMIAAIDGASTQGVSLTKIVRTLRGKPGTDVTLTLVRSTKKTIKVTVTRRVIHVQSVKSKLEPESVGYVRITQFGETTPADVRNALTNLKQQSGGDLKGLVLDLRDDPGGLLSAAVDVTGDFVSGGTVVTIRGRDADDDRTFNAPVNATLLPQQTPIVVLINGASASASEIVAGALQDRKRATVMGTQSFGKGSVQTIIPLNGHGAVRLTTALYYTPSGRSIQGKGITPNETVEVPKDQQIAGGFMLRESQLQGAFHTPRALGKQPPQEKEGAPGATAKTESAPIKIDLIGTEQDAQLKAALAYLRRSGGATTGTKP